jgi:hypothetical protein
VSTTDTPRADAAVAAYVAQQGITEVLHFTTNKGGLGIIAAGAILSRDRLPSQKHLEHIYTPNCRDRSKDAAWTDYVSLSISRVNGHMFGYSERWHSTEDLWWMIFSLDPSVLADPGVYFVTTNNTYTNCLRRGTGVEALSALFADSVEWGWRGSRIPRYASMPDAWPTDPQAEVLYPGQVPVDKVRTIYVREEEHADTVRSWFPLLAKPAVPVIYRPEVFR